MTAASTQDGTYPRPQLVRPAYQDLDRDCGFAYDDDQLGLTEGWQHRDDIFTRTIQLPFAPESPASGIGETGYHPVVWYRLPLTPADLTTAGWQEQGDRLLLHFGAVDYMADVWVNGVHVAHHEGGQTAFSADITEAIDTEAAEQVVVVRAEDDPLDVTLPRGKQDWKPEPHAIWYHRITGIWRTVWLEAVPALHIQRLVWTPDLPSGTVRAEVELSRRPTTPATLSITIHPPHADSAETTPALAELSLKLTERTAVIDVPLAGQRNGQQHHELLWSPKNPQLIDATVTLATQTTVDEVASYLGLRSVAVEHGEFLLNDHPFYQRSVLEQGYWPSSHFTAPSPAALREEAELIAQLGFNSVRIHQKVEDPRFLYWCDRLGLLVWGETANAYEFSDLAVQRLTTEWTEIVRQYRSHPSIVTWVPINESWGVQFGPQDPAQRAYGVGLANLTRALDPSRPVISNDGWEHTDSDIWTLHDYEASGEVLTTRYGSRAGLEEQIRGFGGSGRRSSVVGVEEVTLPIMLTEFGGVSYITGEVPEDSWGYSSATDAADFEARLRAILEAIQASAHLRGFCYTQLTDTHQETNGLCDADRRPKLPAETLAAIIRGQS
ncbi:glycoside hydrolase family 2 protein [Nesterenkonia alba]|uniref:glycoside hydrolase family 2 protein n=1 Tax=Nesterenkonia alba TaxID=515814 RepID=UPI0003B6ACE2|nr:glycoside hydrolase family 2 [Nesterenkonia alba]